VAKRIVICCDGTWNTPDEQEGDALSTNVVKMAHATRARDDQGVDQVIFYDRGVGTSRGADQFIGGALGVGLSQNIEDAYRFLVDNYVEGDELFLFGFSRGAYTARSLAGLIRNCGLLRKLHSDKFQSAYEIYRSKSPADKPDGTGAVAFIRKFSRPIDKIKFIGVWDTVGALGIPGLFNFLGREHFEFHDVRLSRIVENAFHALALDERRQPFLPTLWEQGEDMPGQTLEQVWFAGVHSNIGGGYSECGLSDVAFTWMAKKAQSCGLALDEEYVSQHISPNPFGVLRDSMSVLYRVLGRGDRAIKAGAQFRQKIHKSALDRMARANARYKPENLQAYKRTAEFQQTE
jgi:uncharacterized protein (DUF2235 family)